MSTEHSRSAPQQDKPMGYTAIGVFLFFGATMATYAAFTLAFPATILDRAWALNPEAHKELATLGRIMAVPFCLLALTLFMAATGWFKRRRWGWGLSVAIISINLLGDVFSAVRGEWLKGAAGVILAGLLLGYITGRQIQDYFRATT